MNNNIIKPFILLFLFVTQLLWSTASFATNYYVHVNAGNNRNSGLQPDDAFETLAYSLKQLAPGDTLYIRSGTYTETVYLTSNQYSNGTPSSPITVKSYPGEAPVIGSNEAAFGIVDLNWWIFEGLTFEKSKPLIFGRRDTALSPEDGQCVSTARNITLRDMRFQHGSEQEGIIITCASQVTIENSLFDNLRTRTAGQDAFGILFAYQADNVLITGSHFQDIGAGGIHLLDTSGSRYIAIEIVGNEFEVVRPYRYRDENGIIIPEGERPFDGVGENGIAIKNGPGPIVITHNLFHGFRPTLPAQDATGGIGEGIVILNQASGITIRENYFNNNTIHLNVGRGSNAEIRPDRSLSVFNNIFEEAADPGIYGNQIPSGIRVNSARNVQVLDNTFINQAGHQGWLLQLVEASNVELKNNAFQNGIVALNTDKIDNLTADHNAWAGVTGNTWTGELYPEIQGMNDIVTNNLGIDPSTREPLASSPLIDTGTPVGITEDFYNTAVSGAGPDIGAVEYQDQDTELPSVLITAPSDGATVSGNVQTSGVASNDNLSDESGGGCTVDANATMDPVWLFLILAPLIGVCRRRIQL